MKQVLNKDNCDTREMGWGRGSRTPCCSQRPRAGSQHKHGQPTNAYNFSSKGFNVLFWPLSSQVHIHTHAKCVQIIKFKKEIKMFSVKNLIYSFCPKKQIRKGLGCGGCLREEGQQITGSEEAESLHFWNLTRLGLGLCCYCLSTLHKPWRRLHRKKAFTRLACS